jgi:AraC-like DNA-binding protein
VVSEHAKKGIRRIDLNQSAALDLTSAAKTKRNPRFFYMAYSIPLIRAASMHPMRRWAKENQLDVEILLAKAGLDWVPENDPYLPIPLRGVVQLLVEISRIAGNDAPHRIVSGRGGFEIGLIGAAAFVGPTVREGFQRISQKMPIHSTHEIFTVIDDQKSLRITDGWALAIGDMETLHFVQQYVAALIDMICGVATCSSPSVAHVELVPHPKIGLTHLEAWLGNRVRPANNRALNVGIRNEVSEMEFPANVREAAISKEAENPTALRVGPSLADQVAVLVGSMLGKKAPPTLDRLAAAAGTSERSLRRQLSDEGLRLGQIVEKVRSEKALVRLRHEPKVSLRELSRDLGYANQETLSRAVKRWTGQTPSSYLRQEKNL